MWTRSHALRSPQISWISRSFLNAPLCQSILTVSSSIMCCSNWTCPASQRCLFISLSNVSYTSPQVLQFDLLMTSARWAELAVIESAAEPICSSTPSQFPSSTEYTSPPAVRPFSGLRPPVAGMFFLTCTKCLPHDCCSL